MPSIPRLPPPAFPIVVSGPSGVGKTVLCRRMLASLPWVARSISASTRPQRLDEKDGESYFFYSAERFEREREAGELAEWAKVHGYLYGTPRAHLEQTLKGGRCVLLNIDVQGGLSIRARYPNAALIFVLPPSIEALEERLRGRDTDSEEEVLRRLARAEREMEELPHYDYVVVNEDLEEAVTELLSIARAERSKVARRLEASHPDPSNRPAPSHDPSHLREP